jgi:YVTN family beta-propeller protein
VTGTIPVGTGPAGVAVNPLTNTAYVANFIDGTVSVISGRTGTVTGTIPVGNNPLVVAVNPVTNKTYVTNFSDGTVSVISG